MNARDIMNRKRVNDQAAEGMEIRDSYSDWRAKRRAWFIANPPVMRKIRPRFQNVPDIDEFFRPIKTDFPDACMLTKKAIVLQHINDEDTAGIGRRVIPMLASGFSEIGAGLLMLLAYQLRDDTNMDNYVLEGAEDLVLVTDVEELSDRIMSQGARYNPLNSINNDKMEAMAYAYIASSALRLFTKPEENYSRSFNQILLAYSRFYGMKIPVTVPAPTIKALKTLVHYFSKEPVFKGTFYRTLYMGRGSSRSPELRRFLYEDHLLNTGMPIVCIFVKLVAVLNCSPKLLLQAMRSLQHARQLKALTALIELASNDDVNHARQMWRYGHIFDETIMSTLRTKTCPDLTYILASALKSVAPDSNKDILNIAQFAQLNAEKRLQYAAVGEKMIKIVRKEISELSQ